MLISRRREAKRRALLQMLDRIPVRAPAKPKVRARPAIDVAIAPAAPARERPRVKQ